MSHNKTLTELKWFKWALWGPIGVAVIIATVIARFDNYPQPLDWGLSSAHINDAIGRLKFPIAIASLAFPFVALVASHHRSVQTAAQIARTDNQIVRTDKQIKATEEKNAFENCIKHRELFNEFLDKIEPDYLFKVCDRDSLYSYVFPKNNFISFSPVSSEFEVRDRKVFLIEEAKVKNLKFLLSDGSLDEINVAITEISKTLFIKNKDGGLASIDKIGDCKMLLIQCSKFLNDLTSFSFPEKSYWALRDELFNEISDLLMPNQSK